MCQSAVACSRACLICHGISGGGAGDSRGKLLCGLGPQNVSPADYLIFSQFQYSRYKKDAGELQAETIVNTHENIKVYVLEREETQVGEKKACVLTFRKRSLL